MSRSAGKDSMGRTNDAEQMGTPATGDLKKLHATVVNYPSYRRGALRRLQANQLTASWLERNGSFRPVLLTDTQQEGVDKHICLHVPPDALTPESIANACAPDTLVDVLDVKTQREEEIAWTLHQWQLYWQSRLFKDTSDGQQQAIAPENAAGAPLSLPVAVKGEADGCAVQRRADANARLQDRLTGISSESRRCLLAVPFMSVANTAVADRVCVPRAVAAIDLASRLAESGLASVAKPAPFVMMLTRNGVVNFALAPGGAATWLHCVQGSALVGLVPPTSDNLAVYAAWSRGAGHKGAFLPAYSEGAVKAELHVGETLLVPPGWSVAVAAAAAAVLVGGHYLRADCLRLHLDALRIEDYLKVQPKLRYPRLRELLWHTAARYARALSARIVANGRIPEFERMVSDRTSEIEREDGKIIAEKQHQHRAAAHRAAAAAKRARDLELHAPKAPAARQRKSPGDSFIASDSGDELGSDGRRHAREFENKTEDEEADWVPDPDAGVREWGTESESDGDIVNDLRDDNGISTGARAGSRRARRSARDVVLSVDDGDRLGGEVRTSKRRRAGQRLAAILRAEDERDDGLPVDSASAPATTLKVKLKTSGGVLSLPPMKLKLKPSIPGSEHPPTGSTIPQIDGCAWDDSPSALEDELELEDGEKEGLLALIRDLRSWIQNAAVDGTDGSGAPSSVPERATLARLHVAMQCLGLCDVDMPPPVDVHAYSPVSLKPVSERERRDAQEDAAVAQATQDTGIHDPVSSGRPFVALPDGEEGGESSPRERWNETSAVVEESVWPKERKGLGTHKSWPGMYGGTSAGRATSKTAGPKPATQAKGLKKLSAKERLKKKLKL